MIFIPRHDFIVSADLSQLEWRVAGVLSQDPTIMREVLDDVDAHGDNATNFFGDISYRQDAKIFTFRMIYGGSAFGFYMDSKMPNFTLKKWRQIVVDFYEKYTGLQAWQSENIDFVAQNGFLRNPSGRIFNFNRELSEKQLVRRVKNYPVQSFSTADIMMLAMVLIYREIKKRGLKSLIIGQVHDSLIFDSPKDEVLVVGRICLEIFRNLPQYIESIWGFNFNLPLDGEIEYGKRYGEMTKLDSRLFFQ